MSRQKTLRESAHAIEIRRLQLAHVDVRVAGALANPRRRSLALGNIPRGNRDRRAFGANARAVSSPRAPEAPVTMTRLPDRSIPSSTSSVVLSNPKLMVPSLQ